MTSANQIVALLNGAHRDPVVWADEKGSRMTHCGFVDLLYAPGIMTSSSRK